MKSREKREKIVKPSFSPLSYRPSLLPAPPLTTMPTPAPFPCHLVLTGRRTPPTTLPPGEKHFIKLVSSPGAAEASGADVRGRADASTSRAVAGGRGRAERGLARRHPAGVAGGASEETSSGQRRSVREERREQQ